MSPAPIIRLDSPLPAADWTFAPSPPRWLLRCDGPGRPAALTAAGGRLLRTWPDPLDALAWLGGFEGAVSSQARWIGFLSYDLGRLFESIPATARDDLGLPLFCFTLHDDDGAAPAYEARRAAPRGVGLFANVSPAGYRAAVERALGYIRAGDIFQVNLSQRFAAGMPESPAEIYQRLLDRSPGRFGALLEYEDFALICNSPETFLKVDSRRIVTTRPIKGTRPRGPGMAKALLNSAKDQAELNMIIDLERNDLGRICQIGSVRVVQPRAVETHPTVHHGVATIQGLLRPKVGLVDLLRAAFPGGSITGAPKIRAMQIIEELEPCRRGPYCGAIGFLAPSGEMEFNIAIRTMIAKEGLVHIPVGGGIVADSSPDEEYQETLVKARAMFEALGVALAPQP